MKPGRETNRSVKREEVHPWQEGKMWGRVYDGQTDASLIVAEREERMVRMDCRFDGRQLGELPLDSLLRQCSPEIGGRKKR